MNCTPDEQAEYREEMYANEEFLSRVEFGRNPKYVFACLLRVGDGLGGVVCIDGRTSANITGGLLPLKNLHKNSTQFVQAQLVEGLVESCCEYLARRCVRPLYRCVGESIDDDD